MTIGCVALASAACGRSTVPSQLSDRDFWTLVEDLSEAPGAFALSDNLVSNEPRLSDRVRALHYAGRGAYIGVGPEQNFSYIARVQPSVAFIVDIRRENRSLHLLYKALFEITSSRAEFVSRLFSRECASGLGSGTSVDGLFEHCAGSRASRQFYTQTAALVRERLRIGHGFPLDEVDLASIDRSLLAFLEDGPDIHFWGKRQVDSAHPSYRLLMTERDYGGESRSYLASEEGFRFVKALQSRNMIIPVIGDFGGPKAIRGIGAYVRAHGDKLRAFYGSNVGVYLTNEKTREFCTALLTLPVTSATVFIENNGVRPFSAKLKDCPPVQTTASSAALPEWTPAIVRPEMSPARQSHAGFQRERLRRRAGD